MMRHTRNNNNNNSNKKKKIENNKRMNKPNKRMVQLLQIKKTDASVNSACDYPTTLILQHKYFHFILEQVCIIVIDIFFLHSMHYSLLSNIYQKVA